MKNKKKITHILYKLPKRIRRSVAKFLRELIRMRMTSTGHYLMMVAALSATFFIILALTIHNDHVHQKALQSGVYPASYEIPEEVLESESEHVYVYTPSEQALEEMELTLRAREDMVYDMLIAEGFTPEGVCGIMGNMSVENENFDPTVEANNGMTFGLFQWNDVGGRRSNLVHYCLDQHLHFDTIEGQISFAVYEIRGGDSIARRLEDYLETTNDTYAAAMEFTAGFERCIASKDLGQGKYTASLYPEFKNRPYQNMNKRISRALNYANRYLDK